MKFNKHLIDHEHFLFAMKLAVIHTWATLPCLNSIERANMVGFGKVSTSLPTTSQVFLFLMEPRCTIGGEKVWLLVFIKITANITGCSGTGMIKVNSVCGLELEVLRQFYDKY